MDPCSISEKSMTEDDQLHDAMVQVLVKLKHNPSSITIEWVDGLFKDVVTPDKKSATVMEAIKAFALSNDSAGDEKSSLSQSSDTSILTLVKDLNAAVEACPSEITFEALHTTQSTVSRMSKAISHVDTPSDDLEIELRNEKARIESKIEQGTVTKSEADHLHSLENRAHGHTERKGITATAQSVVDKRERKNSLSSKSGHTSEYDGDRNGGKAATLTPDEQSHRDKVANFHRAEEAVKPKIEQGTVTRTEASFLQSREDRAHGHIEKHGLAATAQSVSDKREQNLSDCSNRPSPASEADYEHRKEQAQRDNDLDRKLLELDLDSTSNETMAGQNDAKRIQSPENLIPLKT